MTVNFTVKEEAAVYKLTASPEAVDFGSAEEGYEQAPEAQTITVTNAGNKELTLSQPLAENFKAGALSATVIAPGESSTFSVQPGMKLKAGTYKEVLNIPYGDGLSVQVTLSFKVTEKKAETIKLTGIQKPSDIAGLKNGTEKSAKALGLPSTVVIKTSKDKMKAKVKWDVQGAEYDQSSKDAQTFKVKGTVTLPDGITNPDKISLVTSVTVTVDAGRVAKIADASDNKITGIQAEGYTTQSKITFTAVGAGMDNANPGKGDVRYLPLNWKVINTNSWDNAPYTATFGITKAGTYTLSVVFNRQQFDGSNWVNTSEQDTKSVEFKIGNPQNVTPTVTPANNQKSAVKTGDNTPIAPFVIVLVIAVGAIAGVVIYKKKNK